METKTCRRCNESKPLKPGVFHRTGKVKKNGQPEFHSVCISCVSIYGKEYRAQLSVKRNTEKATRFWCELEIECASCGNKTPHWFRSLGKRKCQACEAIRRHPNRKRDDFPEYRSRLMLAAESKYLRRYCGKNRCQSCGVIHQFDTTRRKRWQHVCDACERATIRAYRGTRRERFVEATPPWVDLNAIAAIYSARPDGHHVDHLVPLSGKTPDGRNVCGLHVPWNLRYLPETENIRRCNRMSFEDLEFVEGQTIYRQAAIQ